MPASASTCVRRFGLVLLLLAVPACGLSDYEALMRDAQEREARFREEQKYLDKPVQVPTQRDEKGVDLPVANVYFRPPKGILPKPQARGELMWRYAADPRNSDFHYVDMAFAAVDDKEFAARVLAHYGMSGQTATRIEIKPPWQTASLTFDRWESGTISINIIQGVSKPIAIVYSSNKIQQESVRKAITLSLQSLGVDPKAAAARQYFERTSPWKLEVQPGP